MTNFHVGVSLPVLCHKRCHGDFLEIWRRNRLTVALSRIIRVNTFATPWVRSLASSDYTDEDSLFIWVDIYVDVHLMSSFFPSHILACQIYWFNGILRFNIYKLIVKILVYVSKREIHWKQEFTSLLSCECVSPMFTAPFGNLI